jgi:hypothetical protein
LIESDTDINKTRIVKATFHLPKSVDEAYERILSKSHDFEEAKRLLHIVVAAARPLTLTEMNLALALREITSRMATSTSNQKSVFAKTYEISAASS